LPNFAAFFINVVTLRLAAGLIGDPASRRTFAVQSVQPPSWKIHVGFDKKLKAVFPDSVLTAAEFLFS
jgi:hypothetical protein